MRTYSRLFAAIRAAFYSVSTLQYETRLPRWAQRSNPLVRRNLRPAASREHLDLARLVRMLLVYCGLVLASLALIPLAGLDLSSPLLLLPLAPAITAVYALLLAAFFGVPALIALYAAVLVRVSNGTAGLVLREREDDRLSLLRTVPAPLRSIFLSQAAASIWNEIAVLDTLVWLGGLLSLPPIVVLYGTLWFPDAPPLLQRLAMIAGLVTAFLRPWLELIMAGALGALTGSFARYRISAGLGSALLLGAYFALATLPRLLPLGPLPRLLVEVGLPLALPPLVTLAALAVAQRALTAD
jgi:hypothetical protein